MIRRAEKKDIDGVVKMAREFAVESGYVDGLGVDFNDDAVRGYVEVMLTMPDVYGVFLDDENRGFVVGAASQYLVDPTKKMAAELAWWVSPEARGGTVAYKLMDALIRWASEVGATLVAMSAIDALDGEKVGTAYEGMGFRPAEKIYMKNVAKEA